MSVHHVYSHKAWYENSNSQVRFKACHFIDSYIMKFPSSKWTKSCELIYNELCKSPVKSFVKCTVNVALFKLFSSSVILI